MTIKNKLHCDDNTCKLPYVAFDLLIREMMYEQMKTFNYTQSFSRTAESQSPQSRLLCLEIEDLSESYTAYEARSIIFGF